MCRSLSGFSEPLEGVGDLRVALQIRRGSMEILEGTWDFPAVGAAKR